MGRERTRTGKHIYVCAAGLIFFLLSCSTMRKEFTWISEKGGSPQEVQTQEEQAKPTSGDISRARELFDLGKYAASLKESQEILSRSSKDGCRDQALLLMGLIYAHAENPRRDSGKALYFFRTVLEEYPHTHLAAEARVLVGVLQENQKLGQTVRNFKKENEELSQAVEKVKKENHELSRVIEKSKQVDIEVEEKKREKAR
jgi:arsenate reductase-like glutaredoxin family protein